MKHVSVLREHRGGALIPSSGGLGSFWGWQWRGNNWAQPGRHRKGPPDKAEGPICKGTGEASSKFKSFCSKRQNHTNPTNCRRQKLRQPCKNLHIVNVPQLWRLPLVPGTTSIWQRHRKAKSHCQDENFSPALKPRSQSRDCPWDSKAGPC